MNENEIEQVNEQPNSVKISINQKILIGQFILKPKSVLVSIILHEGIIIVPLQVVGHAVE